MLFSPVSVSPVFVCSPVLFFAPGLFGPFVFGPLFSPVFVSPVLFRPVLFSPIVVFRPLLFVSPVGPHSKVFQDSSLRNEDVGTSAKYVGDRVDLDPWYRP